MKTHIDKANERGYFDHGWLKTYHSFSFAEYHNPRRINFGALRVLNDDWIAPSAGFDTHPHRNMEVVTIPLKGFLRHGDSQDNLAVISPGIIQLMSAGRGIYHSEYNDSETQPAEILQIWVIPDKENTQPKYENHDIRGLLRHNELSLFISPTSKANLHQYAWFSWGEIDSDREIAYHFKGDRTGVYLFVVEGQLAIEGQILDRRDGIEISETDTFTFSTLNNSIVLCIEVSLI